MQTRMKLFVIFVAIFAMVATVNAQQSFAPDKNGEVSAMTSDVRSLMERADKVIIETTQDRLDADRKVVEAENELKRVIADNKARSMQVVRAKMEYVSAILDAQSARKPVGEATHKAAMAYFDNVNAAVKAGFKLAVDGYGEWQAKTLPITHFGLPSEFKSLMEQADKATKATWEREAKLFEQLRSDFAEIQKRDKELRDKISK